jgi:hypothetical protein
MNPALKYWLQLFAVVTVTTVVVLWLASVSPVAAFFRIHEGMPADEVFAILGEPTGGDVTAGEVMSYWDRFGCRIVVTFDAYSDPVPVVDKQIEFRFEQQPQHDLR